MLRGTEKRRRKKKKEKQLLLEEKALNEKETIDYVDKFRRNIDEKEKQLEEEEEGADEECMVAERLLEYAARNLRTAIGGGDMVGIRVAIEIWMQWTLS